MVKELTFEIIDKHTKKPIDWFFMMEGNHEGFKICHYSCGFDFENELQIIGTAKFSKNLGRFTIKFDYYEAPKYEIKLIE